MHGFKLRKNEKFSLSTHFRYVREWLGAVVTAGIVDLDSSGDKFLLPAHRIPYLTRNGSKNKSVVWCKMVTNLTTNAFYKVKDCFPRDGPAGNVIISL